MPDSKEMIRQFALELGFDDCRFTSAQAPESAPHYQKWVDEGKHGAMGYLHRHAPKKADPQQVLPGAQSIISLATAYPHDASPTSPGTGIVARYARGHDYHDVLTPPLKALSARLDETGGPESRSLWYTDTGPILERDFAQRAGIGFVGKHTNVINRTLGNWIFLSEIITTIEFESDNPERNRCGTCSRCIDACPTKAITAPFQLDARLCISYLTIELKGSIPTELRPAMGNRVFGCDDCLEVCPWNRFARESRLMKEQHRPDLATADLSSLLKMDNASFKKEFANTPMLRSKRRGLLRNAAVALGNVGTPRDLPVLKQATGDEEPLVAEHADWAIQQIEARAKAGASPQRSSE